MELIHQTEHYNVYCIRDNSVDKIKKYINDVEKVWPTLIEMFSFLEDNFRKKYPVYFGNMSDTYYISNINYNYEFKSGRCDILDYKFGNIACNKNLDQLDKTYPKNLWGGVVHETIHGFLQPIKKYPNSGRHNYLRDEAFEFIVQEELYKKLYLLDKKVNKNSFKEKLDKEGENKPLYKELNLIWEEKGFNPFLEFFQKLYRSSVTLIRDGYFIDDVEKYFPMKFRR